MLSKLPPRERQIVAFITTGCSNREIAARMGLRTQTVKNHLCRIYRKLGIHTRAELGRVGCLVESGRSGLRCAVDRGEAVPAGVSR